MNHKVKIFLASKGAKVPTYAHPTDACFDIYYDGNTILSLPPGEVVKVHTGIHVELPKWTELIIKPRSSMGARGIIIPNSPGTVDADYRDEILVLLCNVTNGEQWIEPGDRIAQGQVKTIEQTTFHLVKSMDDLSNTDRGFGGFGSTGR